MMNYIGEQLWPGQLGHFSIILAFVMALVATYAYFKSTIATTDIDKKGWMKLARLSYIIEVIAILIIFSCLLHILYYHRFEYKYAWQHSSKSLEVKYLLSSLWEGQEGSTLLWIFWHAILGLFLIKKSGDWEAPVMTIVNLAQFILLTFILGIYIFDINIGANPFILLRDSDVFANAPAMHLNFDIHQPIRPDYLTMVTDGNDLNPLLQNYWMVIHPPVLFLGFAALLFPFSYTIAALWTKKYNEWITPTLPWALFGIATLGLGIMMGAKWAYESLNFGGYWAWDPVENASLVPWMMLVSGLHAMLIYRKTGFSLRSSYIFISLSFIFILYSTFLTKSGILGESSVHAFADIGLNGQLYFLMYFFTWLPAISIAPKKYALYIIAASLLSAGSAYYLSEYIPGYSMIVQLAGYIIFILYLNKTFPTVKKEESASSREFWMFIGSLVFFLSAIIIIIQTSLPVFNKLFNLNIASPENHEFAYNQIQVLVAIIIGLITAVSQYLKYKNTPGNFFLKKMLLPTVISLIISAIILFGIKINYDKEGVGFLFNIWLALVASVYAAVANLLYIWSGLKGNIGKSGGSIAHFGFGLMMVGIILSSANKEVLSINTSGIAINFGKESTEKTGENLTLVQNVPTKMSNYMVTYSGDSAHPKKQQTYFKIDFTSPKESFVLWPNAFINYKGNMGLMSNPSSKHYWDHDVFTYISALPNPEDTKDTSKFIAHSINEGDTVYYSKGYMVLNKVTGKDNLPLADFKKTDMGYTASVTVQQLNGNAYQSDLLLIKRETEPIFQSQDTILSQNLVLQLTNVNGKEINLGVKETTNVMKYVTLKAYKFPYINLLWAGVIFLVIGVLMSMWKRIKYGKSELKKI